MNIIIKNTNQSKKWDRHFSIKKDTKIPKHQMSNPPYNGVFKIFTADGNISIQQGTGFKVADNIIMTAAHCVSYVNEEEGIRTMYTDATCCLKYPYQKKPIDAIALAVNPEYFIKKHTENDFGFLIFDRILPGETITIDSNPPLEGECISIGYPSQFQYFGHEMYQSNGTYNKPYDQQLFLMNPNDQTRGCSGGPIINQDSGKAISLNRGHFGPHTDENMSGPILGERAILLLEKLKQKFPLAIASV